MDVFGIGGVFGRAAPTCISKMCLICKNKKLGIWHTCANAAVTCTNAAAQQAPGNTHELSF